MIFNWKGNNCRYYSLDVSYFKSALDRRLLESLWNKYWVNTLSSSSLLTVSNIIINRKLILQNEAAGCLSNAAGKKYIGILDQQML